MGATTYERGTPMITTPTEFRPLPTGWFENRDDLARQLITRGYIEFPNGDLRTATPDEQGRHVLVLNGISPEPSRLTRDDYELIDVALTFLTTVAAPADYPWARGIEWEIVHRAFGGDPSDLNECERRVVAQIVDVFVTHPDDCNPHGIARDTMSSR